jgi:hypothetical protein
MMGQGRGKAYYEEYKLSILKRLINGYFSNTTYIDLLADSDI